MKAGWIDFKAVKERADFLVVLEHYGLKVTRKGEELTSLCPFHAETKPSFRLNLKKGVFHCFGCSAKGNVLDFVSRKEGCTIRRAAELVAGWCGLDGVVSGGTETAAPLEKSSPRGTEELAQGDDGASEAVAAPGGTEAQEGAAQEDASEKMENRILTFQLKLDPEHPYLKERGLNAATIEDFGLGYCSRGVMKGRIAIPIYDVAGELVAYAGRWPGEDIPNGEEKYKLPPGFKKSHVLFNLHRVKHAQELIIVEGYWSVFRLHAFVLPAVALMGRDLSDVQLELLEKCKVRRVVLMLDGDQPGREAMSAILPRLARRCFVRAVDLPEGAQPDTLPEAQLRELLSS